MERRALVIQRQSMTCATNLRIEAAVGKFQRQYPLTNPARHLVDWQAVSGDRIPQAKKFDLLDRHIFCLVVALAQQEEDNVAQDAEDGLNAKNGMKALGSIGSVSHLGLVVNLRFGAALNEALVEHKPDDDPHGEGPAAEAEAV